MTQKNGIVANHDPNHHYVNGALLAVLANPRIHIRLSCYDKFNVMLTQNIDFTPYLINTRETCVTVGRWANAVCPGTSHVASSYKQMSCLLV